MNYGHKKDWADLRTEIAMAAARMIAEEGTSYEAAKKRAARQILGNSRMRGEFLPDNGEIEEELKAYNTLFLADTQPARLLHLRRSALEMMREMADFRPHVTGAILNGTAGEHSDIHLQLFAESAKDVEIFLLNRNIDIDVTEAVPRPGGAQAAETIHFFHKNEVFHLSVYSPDDQRKMVRSATAGAERADIRELERLIVEQIGQTN